MAYQRFKAGSSTAFSQGLGEEGVAEDGTQYQGYQQEPGYSEQPFQGGGQQGTHFIYIGFLFDGSELKFNSVIDILFLLKIMFLFIISGMGHQQMQY